MLPVLLSGSLSVDVEDAGYFVTLGSIFFSAFAMLVGLAATGAAVASRTRLLKGTLLVVAIFCVGLSVGIYGVVHRASLPTWLQLSSPASKDTPEKAVEAPHAPESPSTSVTAPPESPNLVTIDLGTVSGAPVTAYFGQHRAAKDAMDELGVTMDQSEGFVDAFPSRCAEGIVVGPVLGDSGAVYALGFGEGWSGLELEPSSQLATDDGLLHQQFISPPDDLEVGSHLDISAQVSIDGEDAYTASFPLQLTSRDGISSTWEVAGAGTITCDVTT